MKRTALVVLGRGIEKVSVKDKDENREPKWRPTRLLEIMDRKGWHPGRANAFACLQRTDAVVGGGNANTIAAAWYYRLLHRASSCPEVIIFAAGRPDYLADEHESLTEGTVMVEKFLRKTRMLGVTAENVRILAGNRNTYEDVLESLLTCKKRGIRQATVITVEVHMSRTVAFFCFVREKYPDLRRVRVHFKTAEELLLSRYANHSWIEKIRHELQELRTSPAYAATWQKEKIGIRALREGRYDLSDQGYGFTIHHQLVPSSVFL